MKLWEKRQPKVIYLSDNYYLEYHSEDEEDVGVVGDHEDRLPRELFVRKFDIFCFAFAIITYIFDISSDCVVAHAHWNDDRFWPCVFVIIHAVVPSIILNVVAFVWILDDETKPQRGIKPKFAWSGTLVMKLLACVLQGGPILYYITAIISAVRFRKEVDVKEKRRHFCRMIEAERDATLLRFFEAFLESAPQLLIQGYILADFIWTKPVDGEFPRWVFVQLGSIMLSLISVCWSISIQHRSLRMARPDKVNMHPHESILQLIWRGTTVISRYLVLITFCLGYGFWMILFFAIHFFISLVQISALQSLDTKNHSILEIGLITINAGIHQFTPFNMADGSTRWRYAVAYTIEGIEGVILIGICLWNENFDFPYKYHFAGASAILFTTGIITMTFYYSCFHPNRRRHIRIGNEDHVDSKPGTEQEND